MARDSSRRQIRAPARYAHAEITSFAFNTTKKVGILEPKSYKEAITCLDKGKWCAAMEDEKESLNKNNTWILVDKPENQKVDLQEERMGSRRKRDKARLTAKGFTQQEGVDYEIY